MEIISIAGYTEIEKHSIAKNHLFPKQLKEHGLTKSQLQLKMMRLLDIIRYYTREAGVRSLERQIASICRKAAKQIVSGDKETCHRLRRKHLKTLLVKRNSGMDKRKQKIKLVLQQDLLIHTVGGDTLQIEVSLSPGKGKLHIDW